MKLEDQVKDSLLQHLDDFLENNSKGETLEWEFKMGTTSENDNGYFGNINRNQFYKIISRFNQIGNYKRNESEQLDITLEKNSDYRIFINGRSNIIDFCKENKLVLGQLNFMEKKRFSRPVDINDYNIRSNLKSEMVVEKYKIFKNIPMSQLLDEDKSAKFEFEEGESVYVLYNGQEYKTDITSVNKDNTYNCSSIENHKWREIYDNLNITKDIYNKSTNKFFRYKKRTSFVFDDGFTVDFTIVKDSSNDFSINLSNMTRQQNYWRSINFKDSGLLYSKENYEIEIECNYNQLKLFYASKLEAEEEGEIEENIDLIDDSIKSSILNNMIKYAGYILQVQQNYIHLLSNSIKNTIQQEYNILINNIVNDNTIITNVNKDLTKLNWFLEVSTIKRYNQFLWKDIPLIDTNRDEITQQRFIGPSPVSLSIDNINKNSNININQFYTVTDKADGDGCLLFINSEGDGYLIDSNQRFRKTNIKCIDEPNTILNGEFISHNLRGALNYTFYVYDIYVRNSLPTYQYPLAIPDIPVDIWCNGSNNDEKQVYNISCNLIVKSAESDTRKKGKSNIYNINIILPKLYSIGKYTRLPRINDISKLIESDPEFIRHYGNKKSDLIKIILRSGVDDARKDTILSPIKTIDDKWIEMLDNESNILLVNLDDKSSENVINNLDEEVKPLQTRLSILKDCIENIRNSNKLNNDYPLQVYLKKFKYCNILPSKNTDSNQPYDCSIYKYSNDIWNIYESKESPYKYDGLIYTPMFNPVGYNNTDNNFSELPGRTWYENLKWKPPNENTIDFLVEYQKSNNRDCIKKFTNLNNNDELESISYKTLNLFVGGYLKSNHLCNYKSKHSNVYTAIDFSPLTPHIDGSNKAMVKINNNNVVCIDDNSIVENNSIIECAYDTTSNTPFKWIMKRTRYDKTFSYHSGLSKKKIIYKYLYAILDSNKVNKFKQFWEVTELLEYWNVVSKKEITYEIQQNRLRIIKGTLNTLGLMYLIDKIKTESNYEKSSVLFYFVKRNFDNIIKSYNDIPLKRNIIKYGQNENVANNIWECIHNPITTEMITKGELIPTINNNDIYYSGNFIRNNSSTIHLQKIHNYIKKNYLLEYSYKFFGDENKSNITLLDLACGKAGDLFKWNEIGFWVVVGIDISNDNLNNKQNGACLRYRELTAKNNKGTIPYVYFFQADSSKNIKTQILSKDNLESELFNKLWQPQLSESDNIDSTSNTYLTKIPKTLFDINKFNIISLQFALHYFTKNSQNLQGLIENIVDNIQKGGVFIGCCFDGKKIYKSLCDSNNITGNDGNDIIWKISKKYHSQIFKDLPDDESSLGLSIDVYMNSIDKVHQEYLVNFDYLTKQLKKYDITPLENPSSFFKSDKISTYYNSNNGTLPFNHILNDIDNVKNKYMKNVLDKMSVDERTLSNFNVAFIYKKN